LVVGWVVVVLPAVAGAVFVQLPYVAWWGWLGVGVVEVGEAVVARALEAAVELVGALAVGPRLDVADVAGVGADVAAGGVLAVSVADLDRPT
jgi:hypothetical protein